MEQVGFTQSGFTQSVSDARTPELRPPTALERHRWPSIGAILGAQSLAAVGGLGTAALDGPHWAAAAAALTLGGGALIRWRGTSAAEWAVRRFRLHPLNSPSIATTAYPGGGSIGVIREASGLTTALTTALTVEPRGARVVSVRNRDDDELPLGMLASVLTHADSPADHVTVVIRGGRAPSAATPPQERYRTLLGPIARWATTTVEIAVTINTVACAPAIARRGGDANRVAAFAARRVADLLAAQGIATTPVDSGRIARVPVRPAPGATAAALDALAVGDVDELCRQSDATGTLVLSLRGAAAAPRPAVPDVAVSAWLQPTERHPGLELAPLAVTGPAYSLGAFHIPLDGAGQILGSDSSGNPIAARLHGPGVHTVWASLAQDPARQLVERAVATGARVLIVTGRPAMWRGLVSWVNHPAALWISGVPVPTDYGQDQILAANYTVTVLDGTAVAAPPEPNGHFGPGQPGEPHGTVWRLEPTGTSPVTEADVVISQPQPGLLTVRTDGGATTVRLVA